MGVVVQVVVVDVYGVDVDVYILGIEILWQVDVVQGQFVCGFEYEGLYGVFLFFGEDGI